MKFDDILEVLESDKKILDFKFSKSQIPMYLFIRFMLIQSLINKEFNLSNPHIKSNKKSIKEIFKYIYHTLKSNIFFAPKKDIYIFSTEIVNKLENGKYVNKLYDEFYNLFKDKTQIIEASHNKSYFTPKKEKIFYIDIINIAMVIFSKFAKKKPKDAKNTDDFIKYLKSKNIFDDEVLNQSKDALKKIAKRENISIFIYRLFFKIKKPKLILINAGFYGDQSFLIYSAKSLNIKVVEYQHGYIGLSHPAYNYHKNIFENIKQFFPDYLLTHGKYWSDRVRVPSQKIEIGLPSLIKNIKQIENKKNIILFISSGTTYIELNKLIENSYDSLKSMCYDIVLRPHPSEYPEIEKRYGALSKKDIKIDKENLYDGLQKAQIVVGLEVSTVLFEAVCFSSSVYLANSKYTKFYEQKSSFISFDNSEELMKFIKNNAKICYSYDYFWEQNWELNYTNFINIQLSRE